MINLLSKLGLSRTSTSDDAATAGKGFAAFGLDESLLRAIASEGYEHPTPIQEQAIPHVLAGRDVLGCAQTGTGKTAAFSLPILQRLSAHPNKRALRALILAPTRELAIQIDESIEVYGRNSGLTHTVIFGGVGQNPQVMALRKHPAILTATPGRLLDLMNQREVDLSQLEIFVLDEADRMLDMGFIHDVKKVISALPKNRQNLLFSATMPPDIKNLADRLLRDPAYVAVTPVSSTAETVDQCVYFVGKGRKSKLLIHLLNADAGMRRVIAFTRTKHGANRLASALTDAGIQAEAIHGNKSQSARQRALSNFKSGSTRVLVASDIAARGIDVEEITHVINVDLPNVPETYVHRIGRTGRAQASGAAIAFCDDDEKAFLRDIEKLTGQMIPRITEHPYAGTDVRGGDGGSGEGHERPPNRFGTRRPYGQQGRPSNRRDGNRRPSQQGSPSRGSVQTSGPRQGQSSTPQGQAHNGSSRGRRRQPRPG